MHTDIHTVTPMQVTRGLVRVESNSWAEGNVSGVLAAPPAGTPTYIHGPLSLRETAAEHAKVNSYWTQVTGAEGSTAGLAGAAVGPSVSVELPPWMWLVPSHYSLTALTLHAPPPPAAAVAGGADESAVAEAEAVRNWRVVGSGDGEVWHVVRRHVDDASLVLPARDSSAAVDGLPHPGARHVWPVDVRLLPFAVRFLRIVVEGERGRRLTAAGFDVFGATGLHGLTA